MPISDIFQVNKLKAELQQARAECDRLTTILAGSPQLELYQLKQAIASLEEQKAKESRDLEEATAQAAREIEEGKAKAAHELEEMKAGVGQTRRYLDQQLEELNRQIIAKHNDLIVLDDELLLQSFGFYKPRYDLQSSDQYKAKLEQIRDRQAALVKTGKAAVCPASWSVNNDKKEGERMIKDYTKLIVRSFNNECDASIVNIKFNNVESIQKKITKAFDVLNDLGQRMQISLTRDYLNLKLQELYLCHEYQIKKQEEKEEQKRIREEIREEAKALKEIEEMKLKIEKEEKHFTKALQTIEDQLAKTQTDAERASLQQEKAKIEQQLEQTEKNKQDVLNREQNTRAGYVYVISNIGAFGEDVYKIGVTRRLEPNERIDELGDSSVPFDFDIHALIFSEDAPKLENALHKAFAGRKLNMVNPRREFFGVTLDEIENVIKTNFNKPVEMVRVAEAAEFRQSLLLKNGNGR